MLNKKPECNVSDRWENYQIVRRQREALRCQGIATIREAVYHFLIGEPELGLKLAHLADLAFTWDRGVDDEPK